MTSQSAKKITVGMPVWKGQPHISDALECLLHQSFKDFEVIISVDGNDSETAKACAPFLSDRRFRMVVHTERLDWFGNFNWLLQQPMGEFFCYRQHDDTTSLDFFETLLSAADANPNAAAVYADCQWRGSRSDVESTQSISGSPLERITTYIERLDAPPVRGLIRRAAICQAGLVRSDEFRGLTQILTWLAKVVRWGDFIRVPLPIYYRLDHPENFHKSWYDWPEEKKRAAWTTLFTGLLEAALPLCSSIDEKLCLEHLALDRVITDRPGRATLYPTPDAASAGRLKTQCYERLQYELQNGLCSPSLREILTLNRETNVFHDAADSRLLELQSKLSAIERSRAFGLARRVRRLLRIEYPGLS